MERENNLRFPFNKFPKWVVVTFAILLLPVWLIVGVAGGFCEGVLCWLDEIQQSLES